jgi:RNA polymerase sigma-70 factor (ECF subfamily)
MAVPPEQFSELLTRARQGDHAALVRLTEEYEPDVRLVARVLLGPALRPHVDSVDLVQSVHHSVMIGLRHDRFDISKPENLVALALTILRRKVARKWRRHQRQERHSLGPADSGNLPPILAGLDQPAADPAEALAYQDGVQQLFHHLDETERKVMELRLQGHSTAEVARQLNLDPDALRVRLHRLRQRLRAAGALEEWL